MGDDGLLEIKSLKIFHDNTIDQIVNDTDRVLVSKDNFNRKCFSIKDNKCNFIEMRVPRDLNPFVTSSSFLTDAPHNANVLMYPMATAMNLNYLMMTLLMYPMATVTSLIYPVSTVIMYPMTMVIIAVVCLIQVVTLRDEIHIAVLLTTCASSYHSTENNLLSDCNFKVIPWSGITSDGVKLVNTCPIDNWLMIFQSLARSGRLNLHNLNQAGELINNAL